jgi:hypothetical protein
MAYEKFIDKNFQAKTLTIIEHAREITEDYKRRGFTLTLRQLFYQFVARDLLPNKQAQYKRLGNIVDEARQAGLLDWSTIEDRTRNVERPSVWTSPESIIRAVAEQYQEDPWRGQKYRPEVWIEKDALVGVVEPVCERFKVPYFACRGYTSQSEAYAAGKRFQAYRRQGFTPIVLHLGDHDPSGLHMTVDNGNRLDLFSYGHVEVRRLALNMDQIEQYDPPPNPAKETDSRFESYAAEHGESSWELDALDPDVIDQLIEDALRDLIDQDAWDKAEEAEREHKEGLEQASDNWEGVARYLKYKDGEADFEALTSIGVSTIEEALVEIEAHADE